MIEVSRNEFFEAINKLNVHPRIVSKWSESVGYRSEWRMQDWAQALVGVSEGRGLLHNEHYWLVKGA